jgi:hypothetical protein
MARADLVPAADRVQVPVRGRDDVRPREPIERRHVASKGS